MPRSTVEREGTAHGLRFAVLLMDMGHRCGYVAVPEDHPFYGRGYSEKVPWDRPAALEDRAMDDAGMGGMIALLGGADGVDEWARRVEGHVAVHGGLTFAGKGLPGLEDGWWFGFDCAHADDSPSFWTEERVAKECVRLAQQLAEIAAEVTA